MKQIAVIDLAICELFIYTVRKNYDSEKIETFLTKKGHHLSNCSWGEFNGEINFMN